MADREIEVRINHPVASQASLLRAGKIMVDEILGRGFSEQRALEVYIAQERALMVPIALKQVTRRCPVFLGYSVDVCDEGDEMGVVEQDVRPMLIFTRNLPEVTESLMVRLLNNEV